MKIDWCKILGHRFVPIFVKGWFSKEEVKFIATVCSRCDLGEDELRDTVKKMRSHEFCTYSEKYWDKSNN